MALLDKSLALVLLCCSGNAIAQNAQSFNSIRQACIAFTNPNVTPDYSQGVCVGLVQGILFSDNDICQPSGSNLGQAVAVVVRYTERIPERWHEPRAKLVYEALKSAWPCR